VKRLIAEVRSLASRARSCDAARVWDTPSAATDAADATPETLRAISSVPVLA
jgi:hypothetical protein